MVGVEVAVGIAVMVMVAVVTTKETIPVVTKEAEVVIIRIPIEETVVAAVVVIDKIRTAPAAVVVAVIVVVVIEVVVTALLVVGTALLVVGTGKAMDLVVMVNLTAKVTDRNKVTVETTDLTTTALTTKQPGIDQRVNGVSSNSMVRTARTKQLHKPDGVLVVSGPDTITTLEQVHITPVPAHMVVAVVLVVTIIKGMHERHAHRDHCCLYLHVKYLCVIT